MDENTNNPVVADDTTPVVDVPATDAPTDAIIADEETPTV
jgi:hypothetical protein